MRIERIEVFQIDLKGTHGGQRLSGGRVFSDLDSRADVIGQAVAVYK
jgi:hypothetical protein